MSMNAFNTNYSLKKQNYLPNQIYPHAPKVGGSRYERCLKAFENDQTALDKFIQGMKLKGQPLGIKFNYNGIVSNTFDAHRLVWKVGTLNLVQQGKIEECILRGFHERESNIADFDTLAKFYVEADCGSFEEALEFLNSNEGVVEVKQCIKEFRDKGLTSVPNIEFVGGETICGAEDPVVFEKIINDLLCKV
ncbi:hypothetical protein HDU92_001316 [Lobulomyces angularis]|nr:hypothetical protein HDU92_001316 [Lobulomyces angularis]